MESLNGAYVEEQNKLASEGAWIWLMEISVAGTGIVLRFTNNNAEGSGPTQIYTTWNGNDYYATPMRMDDIAMSTSGKFPEYKLQLGEVALDSNLRTQIGTHAGLVGSTIRLMIVHTDHLDLTTPAIDELSEILNCELTAQAVTFTIGIPSLLGRRFPRDRYVPTFCRHKYGGALCQYQVDTAHSITSDEIRFASGAQYNTIRAPSTGRFIDDLFQYAPGQYTVPDNLILNGLFEEGYETFWDDWDLWKNSADTQSSSDSPLSHNTGRSALLESNETNGGLSQAIAVDRGRTYSFSCWVYTTSTAGAGSGGVRMMVKIGAYYYSTYAPTNNVWTRLTLTRTIPSTVTEITVYLGGNGRALFSEVNATQSASPLDYDYYTLDANVGFLITGSASNDGFFEADASIDIRNFSVGVVDGDDSGRLFVVEPQGSLITMQLGYDTCEHTLAACKLRDNSQNYGGSPGISGGMYG